MKQNNKVLNKSYMDKYTMIYIHITSILAYFILNLIVNNQKISIPIIFKIYYIILSIVLFVLLNRVKKVYKQYISKIIVIFFSLIIFISTVALIININEKDSLISLSTYLDYSKESILLIETFAMYALSEYYLKNRRLKKSYYNIAISVIVSIVLIYYFKVNIIFIRGIYFIFEVPLFIKIILNMKKSVNLNEDKWNIIKIYIYSVVLIAIATIYGFYNENNDITNVLIEIMHLFNFRIALNIIITKLVGKQYRNLSKSLNQKKEELDKLNYEIIFRNRQLENSINLLRNKEYLYSTFLRFMPHPIIVLNTHNNRILFVNKQLLKIAGISKKRDMINKNISKYIEFIPNNIKNKDYNAIFYIGDKKRFIEAKFITAYTDLSEKLILIKDNTQKVRTEEIRKSIENKKIEESIRTKFLSSISHDLKTPINVIYSAMQVKEIYIKKRNIEVLKKYNNISKQNCISLIKLTNNLIDNSKLNSNHLVPRLEMINLVEVIEDNVMSLVDYVKWNNIDLIFDTNTEECLLNIDREFMDRIILNLVSNAVKFTPEDGKIYVIIVETHDNVKILVKDNGSGIEQEFIYKAFNRYPIGRNCKSDLKNGTRIGLCVVKQLVELQGGNIKIKKNEDIGTTINMEFKKGE